jgi:hypothetical protein
MQASVYKYFERFNFVVTNFTEQYSKKHKQLIAINHYMRLTAGNSYECALKFRKVNQNTWPQLAELAK